MSPDPHNFLDQIRSKLFPRLCVPLDMKYNADSALHFYGNPALVWGPRIDMAAPHSEKASFPAHMPPTMTVWYEGN